MSENIKSKDTVLDEIINKLKSVNENIDCVGIKFITMNAKDFVITHKKGYKKRMVKGQKRIKVFDKIVNKLESIHENIDYVGINLITMDAKNFTIIFQNYDDFKERLKDEKRNCYY